MQQHQRLNDVRQALQNSLGHHPDEDRLALVLQNIIEKAGGLAVYPVSPSCRGSLGLAALCYEYCTLFQSSLPLRCKAAHALMTFLHSIYLHQFVDKLAKGEDVFCEAGDSRLFAARAGIQPSKMCVLRATTCDTSFCLGESQHPWNACVL